MCFALGFLRNIIMTNLASAQRSFRILTLFISFLVVASGYENGEAETPKRSAPNFVARILPLGASIVWGYNTVDGNGFRKPLRDELTNNGWSVDIVGSKQHGTMSNNDVEAHPGDVITQVHTAALNSVKYQPNIVVINAGNNDCHLHIDIGNAGKRMGDLLDDLFAKVPGVTIVLSTLVLSTNEDVEQDRGTLNNQYRILVNDRRAKKQRVVLAELDGTGAAFVEVADLTSDGVHPNDAGHAKIAHTFYQAIVQAQAESLLTEPNYSDAVPEGREPVKSTTSTTSTTSTSTTTPTPSSTSSKKTTTTTSTSTTSSSSITSTTSTSTLSTKAKESSISSATTKLGAILQTKISSTTVTSTVVPPVATINTIGSVSSSIKAISTTAATSPSAASSPTLQNTGAAIWSQGNGISSWVMASFGLALGLHMLI